MTTVNVTLPTKPCHNCRRRRLKCDKSVPVCQKCLSSGTECLGYGKLYLWRNGEASREPRTSKSLGELDSMLKEGRDHSSSGASLRASSLALAPLAPSQSQAYTTSSTISDLEECADTTIHWSLIDPLLKDLHRDFRYYLFHFARQLCADLVICDGPGQNPIRDLIPATAAHPLLLQVMVANSAFHVYNLSRETINTSLFGEDHKPCIVAYYRDVSRFGGPLKYSLRDALIAKQQALSLLGHAVASVNEMNFDVILVTILLFINYDLIESGKDKWKVHMEGARRLIKLLESDSFQQHQMTRLRKCLLSDLLVYVVFQRLSEIIRY